MIPGWTDILIGVLTFFFVAYCMIRLRIRRKQGTAPPDFIILEPDLNKTSVADELAAVAQSHNYLSIEMLREQLNVVGVESTVLGERENYSAPVRLMVRAEDAQRAVNLLNSTLV